MKNSTNKKLVMIEFYRTGVQKDERIDYREGGIYSKPNDMQSIPEDRVFDESAFNNIFYIEDFGKHNFRLIEVISSSNWVKYIDLFSGANRKIWAKNHIDELLQNVSQSETESEILQNLQSLLDFVRKYYLPFEEVQARYLLSTIFAWAPYRPSVHTTAAIRQFCTLNEIKLFAINWQEPRLCEWRYLQKDFIIIPYIPQVALNPRLDEWAITNVKSVIRCIPTEWLEDEIYTEILISPKDYKYNENYYIFTPMYEYPTISSGDGYSKGRKSEWREYTPKEWREINLERCTICVKDPESNKIVQWDYEHLDSSLKNSLINKMLQGIQPQKDLEHFFYGKSNKELNL